MLIVVLVQAAYYTLTGVWPLVSIGTFQAATGPKTDLWLVQTVGVLVVVIGVTLGVAAVRRRFTAEILLLAVGSALAFTAVDVIFTAAGLIGPIYLADAVVQVLLMAALAITARANVRPA